MQAPPDRAPRASGPALEAMHRFLLWLIPTVEKFPRSQKFLLGDRIQNTALDVQERLVEATHTRSREGLLAQANLGQEKLRFLFRIASELQCLDLRRYEHAVRGKRGQWVPAAFVANLERECLRLEDELRSGDWRPGSYVTFRVSYPKPRFISAAPFRDRVVHHAAAGAVPGQDFCGGMHRASHVPGIRTARRPTPSLAGRQRLPVSESAAQSARPLAGWQCDRHAGLAEGQLQRRR